jgi:hypothetical protein
MEYIKTDPLLVSNLSSDQKGHKLCNEKNIKRFTRVGTLDQLTIFTILDISLLFQVFDNAL